MNKRQRRDREHLSRLYPIPAKYDVKKPSRSRRARGRIRTSILGAGLNHRGRHPAKHGGRS